MTDTETMTETEVNSAFNLLADIATRFEEKEISLPAQDAQVSEWRGIGFRVGGAEFLAPMSEVDEILYMPECTKVPGVRPWVNGVANIRGRLLSVIDLGLYLGEKPSVAAIGCRVIVVRQGDLYCGLVVDEVLGMQTFAETDYQSRQHEDERFSDFVSGAYQQGERSWPVFDLYRLAESPAFLQVAI